MASRVPAVTTTLRGLVGFQVRLVTNRKELHSGIYGGAANPVHDLVTVLSTVAGHDQDFSAGIAPVTDEERAGWASLPTGAALMQSAGATPADDRAEADFYRRTWEGPSLTVHSIGCGDPLAIKTSMAPRRWRRCRCGWHRGRTRRPCTDQVVRAVVGRPATCDVS
jgi:hypothetical protein